MDAPPHHRKIDLQSPSDLTHLISVIKASAREKIDRDIPKTALPSAEGGDAFREKVESIVEDYINQTIQLALPSLSINGFDATLPSQPSSSSSTSETVTSQTYEPYDSRLATRLRDLYAKLEGESTRLAELRREGPHKAAERYQMRLREELGIEEGEMGKWRREGQGEEVLLVGDEFGKRVGDVRGSWDQAIGGLRELEGVGGVRARVERAGGVVGVVEGV